MSSLLILGALLVLLLPLAGHLYQRLGVARDSRRFRAPGERIDVGGYRLHVQCWGVGSPAVVLDSALGGSSLSWFRITSEIAGLTRVCAYDRAGFGWSDAGPAPRTADIMVDELRRLLDRVPIEPPYVLVGHSYGALVAQLFAARHSNEVKGLVLVDPPHLTPWVEPNESRRRRIERGARHARRAAFWSRLGLMRLAFALLGLHGMARLRERWMSPVAPSDERTRIITLLDKLPPDTRSLLKRFWSAPKSLLALASQIECVPESAARVATAELRAELPVTVLSAADSTAEQRRAHAELASRFDRGKHVLAHGSSHWIPLDEPEVIVTAIREILEQPEIRNADVDL